MLHYARRGEEPAWPKPDHMPDILWRVLSARGVSSAQEADAFLHPQAGQLLPPGLLSCMDQAASRIRRAAAAREKVWIWGDYDVDGVCATAILQAALDHLGLKTQAYLPSRHDEGYGLNEGGVRQIADEGCDLLVTVDCGINALDLTQLAQSLGMDVIITDHHRPGDDLPLCPVVNPLLNDYPNPGLCGAGVAFKLALALCPDYAMSLIDLAALATVADVVPLLGENRAIVSLGLALMNRRPRPGIQALCAQAGLTGPIRAGHLGFQLGPRLNAGGRVGSARQALDLVQCATLEQAQPLAQALEAQNTQRRALESQILTDAQAQLRGVDLSSACAIVLAGDWNVGVVGLAASRLVERYHLPTVLLARVNGALTGSCRSIPGVDIFEALTAAAPLLTRYGGHRQAAGLTLPEENLPALQERLNQVILDTCDPLVFIPRVEYDGEVCLDQVDQSLILQLEQLQPCGFGNPAPVLRCQGHMAQARPVGKEGAHLSFTLAQGKSALRGIFFSQGGRAEELQGADCDLLFSPTLNSYKNQVSVQLEAKAARLADARRRLCPNSDEWEALLHAFLTKALYNEVFPSGESWDVEALAQAMALAPRGQLVLCADPRGAAALWGELARRGVPAPDVYLGRLPGDPRCWNAICLLPLGDIPKGYRHIWCLGAPGWLLAPGRTCRQAGPPAPWLADLPDTKALRLLYQAARRRLLSPWAGRSALALCRALGQAAGLTPAGCLAGLMALSQLDLVAFQAEPPSAAMRPFRKVQPDSSALFQKLTILRRWEVDEGDTA